MTDCEKLADLLFPDIKTTPEDMEKRYPPRDLPEGAKVTRIAPSPTGFPHLGNLYGALVDERLAHQSGGVFYLRIEDTDAKREVENGVTNIIKAMNDFGLAFDEGVTADGESGDYGPYTQSKRKEIYQTYAKQLVREGKAYPCFCSPEELDLIRKEQEAMKFTPGYYGKWAKWRDAGTDKIEEALRAGQKFVLRIRADGSETEKHDFTDMIKGKITVQENFIDHVILKSDGIPDYHLAHAVDDHLMRTTHVVRDESWLPSLPLHIQLFKYLGFKLPKYCHTAQLMKMDGESKRKLSKRKDPENALSFYHSEGYPVPSVMEYLMTLLNSNFEEWRLANREAPFTDFKFSVGKMSVSGSLFDLDKLSDVSKTAVSKMSAEEVLTSVLSWAGEYDSELYDLLHADMDYARAIFSIGRGTSKPRKDFGKWDEVREYISFFYDALFSVNCDYPDSFEKQDISSILSGFAGTYDENDDQQTWFEKIKSISSANGFCPDMKEYRKDPGAFKGSVADTSSMMRIAVTGRTNSPDMYEVMKILGKERVIKRLLEQAEKLANKNG